jgi:glycosyltransferase involved in cell wall biosynthesis
VKFRRIWAPKHKRLEAIVHTFLGVLYAGLRRPDLVHLQAVGPSIMAPLARLLGLRVVISHHGTDYRREKWGRLARGMIKTGERLGARFANAIITTSSETEGIIANEYGRSSFLVRNGVDRPERRDGRTTLGRYGLASRRYVVMVSRLVREKRHLDLVEAFRRAAPEGWRLVLVGGSDHPDAYARAVMASSGEATGVVCTGLVPRDVVEDLYSHAGFFAFPSSQEGHPIAVLEALSHGLPVIASDIPAHRELELGADHYFPLGHVDELAARIRAFAAKPVQEEDRSRLAEWTLSRYSWEKTADGTMQAYRAALG